MYESTESKLGGSVVRVSICMSENTLGFNKYIVSFTFAAFTPGYAILFRLKGFNKQTCILKKYDNII